MWLEYAEGKLHANPDDLVQEDTGNTKLRQRKERASGSKRRKAARRAEEDSGGETDGEGEQYEVEAVLDKCVVDYGIKQDRRDPRSEEWVGSETCRKCKCRPATRSWEEAGRGWGSRGDGAGWRAGTAGPWALLIEQAEDVRSNYRVIKLFFALL